ncbi:ubiquinone biosynthesis O-methyltransferase, mitochondrial isoform X2 [Latimeria chalumnae]|uniref:ubiquinone biosynthesis O-methyltransferase, mitochondrial isoform X2 n=1 Tax=Latimeria chalumnae TaxID=7897 RepID=UPI00313C304B
MLAKRLLGAVGSRRGCGVPGGNVPVCWPSAKRTPAGLKSLVTWRKHSSSQTTVDPGEMKKFQAWAERWWDDHGEFAALHSMNNLRIPFIRDTLLNYIGCRQPGNPLSGLKLLDVGCGGGLLSEPLGRLGALVTGIDPLENNIRTAELHKSFDPVLNERIQYVACSLEEMAEKAAETFDAVVASEVVEHVMDVESFVICCNQPGGSLFITTINKTELSYALAIIAAERILKIVPRGTHDWEKFVVPEELERLLESNGFFVETITGMLYNPVSDSWHWIGSTNLNYSVHAVKTRSQEQPEAPEPAASKEGPAGPGAETQT